MARAGPFLASPRLGVLAALCLATAALLSACSKRVTEPDVQAPPTSILTFALHDDSVLPLDPDTGAPGVHDAELTIWRDGTSLFLDADGKETDAAGAVPVIIGNATSLTGQLSVPHGEYTVDVAARDTAGRTVATGSALASVSGPGTVLVTLMSLSGSATLQAAGPPAAGEPVAVSLTVRPYEGSGLVVPPAGFDVEWTLTGDALLAETAKSSIGVLPGDGCTSLTVTAAITRAGETQPAAAATLELDADLFCAVAGIGLEDTAPPTVTLEPLAGTARAGEILRLRGTATDADSGMATIEIYDGPVLRHTVAFDEGQAQWQARIRLEDERTHSLTVIATDRAGNQAWLSRTVPVSAAR